MRVFRKLALCALAIGILAQCKGSEVLSPTPSALDLDASAPACPGISSITLSAGPALSVIWTAGSDDVSAPSGITYNIYMKSSGGNYDTDSPTKIVKGQTTGTINSGVNVGTTYTLWVQCQDEAQNKYPTVPANEQSISISDVTAPSQITDLSASNATYTTILLTWSPSDDGSTGTTASNMIYKVYAANSAGVSTSASPLATVTGTTSYLHTSLTPATTWYYKVVAYDASSNASSASNEASTTTVTDSTAPTCATSACALTAGTTTTSQIPLTWTAGSDNVTATASLTYRIYRCSGSVSCDPYAGTLVTTTSAGATSYTNTGLSPSMIYVYGIRAVDGSSNVATNTGTLVSSTQYSNSGHRYVYPTLTEPAIQQGAGVTVANVVGTASGGSAYPDLIVGAPLASEGNNAYRQNGCIYIYAGTAAGTFATLPTQTICAPSVTADGATTSFRYGFSVLATDLDGNGTQDLAVAYPRSNVVYFYLSVNTSGTLSLPTTPDASLSNGTGGTYFGYGMCAGNLDGVGANDLVIVSPSEGTGNNGQVNVYLNTSAAGVFTTPSTTPSTTFSPYAQLTAPPYSFTLSAGPTEQIVHSCAIGNFDTAAPAVTQIVVGSGLTGAAGTFDGAISFYEVTTGTPPTLTYVNSVLGATVLGTTGAQWGDALAAVQLQPTATSSVKALAVGAVNDQSAGTNAGAVYMYTVTKAGTYSLTDTGRQWSGGRDLNGNVFGKSIASAAIWGQSDGTTDMVVGAWLDDQSYTQGAAINLGDVYTYRNVNSSISTNISQMGFSPTTTNASSNQEFGWATCSGDVNNDGRTDVIIGSPRQDYNSTSMTTTTDVGAVYVYYGTASGEIDFATPSQVIYGPGDHASGLFGASCVVMDYNRDGANDLVVGSSGRTVGANTRGAVFIYFGASNTALQSINSDSIGGPVAQNTSLFGASLAAGDFDNDGDVDLAVGSPGVNNTTPAANAVGRVYVYWANSTGVTSTSTILYPPRGAAGAASSAGQHCGNPNLFTGGTRNLAVNYNFGSALATYPTRAKVSGVLGYDLVICAQGAPVAANDIQAGSPAVTNEGVCYIYEGSVNKNSSATPPANDISTCSTNEIRYNHALSGYPNVAYYFGSSITVGKWGTDAIDDLVICARQGRDPDTATSFAGGCLAFYGLNDGAGAHAGGFSQYSGTNPYQNSRNVPSSAKYRYNESTQIETATANQYSYFGQSVLLIDVNNNSTVDLLVGEPWSDNRVAIDGGTASTTLGKDSGRVYLLRGGWSQ